MIRVRRITIMAVAASSMLLGVWTAKAGGDHTGYPAKVICPAISEDAAAHLRLKVYDPQPNGTVTLVYRCMSKGY